MKRNKLLVFIFFLITFLSCNDFLDQSPDQRLEIKTVAHIKQLLVNAYTSANYGLIGELSSDNVMDNQAPDPDNGSYENVGAYNRLQDEMFGWEPASESGSDSPFSIWQSFYHAIAVCNHALQAIEKLGKEDPTLDLKELKGEALISRAYHHFILVNIFCQTYKNENQTDLGIPYVTEPETVVQVHYNRGTVPEVYRKIEQDIIEGIKLIGNDYKIPKYHFTKVSANAFAARFYLFKRDYHKVIEHADIVLGSSPVLRNWKAGRGLPNPASIQNWFYDAAAENNLLFIATYSTASRIYGWRYGCKSRALQGTLNAGGPSGSLTTCLSGKRYFRFSDNYGLFFVALGGEYFEYTDKIAGIGYAHVLRAEFTTDETLLCRAEAKIHLGDLEGAFEDFFMYEDSRYDNPSQGSPHPNLTHQRIINWYESQKKEPKTVQYFPTNTEKICSTWVLDSVQMPYIQTILLYRRVENIHNGMRWFDVKRYGIEYWHKIRRDSTFLTVDDPRRAIQIPADVINAGLEPNPRPATTTTKIKNSSITIDNDFIIQ